MVITSGIATLSVRFLYWNEDGHEGCAMGLNPSELLQVPQGLPELAAAVASLLQPGTLFLYEPGADRQTDRQTGMVQLQVLPCTVKKCHQKFITQTGSGSGL